MKNQVQNNGKSGTDEPHRFASKISLGALVALQQSHILQMQKQG